MRLPSLEEACHCCLSPARSCSSRVGPVSLIPAGFECTTSREEKRIQDKQPYKIKARGSFQLIPFSAFWLRSSVVSVLISLISDTAGLAHPPFQESSLENKPLRLDGGELETENSIIEQEFKIMIEQHAMLEKRFIPAIERKNLKVLGENRSLLKKVLDLKEEMHVLEEENGSILQEAVTVSKLSSVFESFAAEKVEELEYVSLHFPEVL
ncbi:hypothetical protein OIU84_021768 [Salix udensis]|uniref:Uncharacterized protein n=1 Tax=Salix udensis TaxID=889485 RepID=A0AAD6PIM2_9ROSI|nr:hypothetical protein OIU84_021768 [Salix udensis]